jgi:hypothetical protein
MEMIQGNNATLLIRGMELHKANARLFNTDVSIHNHAHDLSVGKELITSPTAIRKGKNDYQFQWSLSI